MDFVGLLLRAAVFAALAQTGSGPQFVDAAREFGLTRGPSGGNAVKKDYLYETTGSGAAIFDFDGDGRNDILLVNDRQPALYRNTGGKFVAAEWPAGGAWGQGVCVADYDRDGRPDVFIAQFGSNRLYRNTPAGFVDISAKAGLPAATHRWGAGCAFLDYDRDGLLDLFVSNYVEIDARNPPKPGSMTECFWKGTPVACGPKGLPMGRNILYRQQPGGTLEDVSARAGILKSGPRFGLGVVSFDYNNDGWPDVYVACDQTPSLLFENRGNGTFTERAVEAGVALNSDGNTQAGMGVAVADFDNDGFFDIAKTNFSGELVNLYRNEDGKFFTDVAQQAGLGANLLLGWGIAFVDADDDGWRDLLIVNGHVYPEVEKAGMGDRYRQKTLFYRNLGNRKFAEVPAVAGEWASRGLAVGDLDGDGRPEALVTNMDALPLLLKNTRAGGNFINIDVRGAVGARVTVRAGGRRQMDEVMSGGSYYSQHSTVLHFGLGSEKTVESVTVRWPNGKIEVWNALPVNSRCVLSPGVAKPSC
ncbi:MAG: CRTAC1 family protein [Acidobacteria bacterium]|nr:CRTAC1 family protein [Acidobacteriota bacterium]